MCATRRFRQLAEPDRGKRRCAVRVAPDPGASSAHGFAYLEILVGMTVSLFLLGGLLAMLYGAQAGYEDFGEIGATQQTARLALMQIQRDLARAGVGLSPMKPVFPVIVPQGDGGVLIRLNPAAATSYLVADMVAGRLLEVKSAAPFMPGTAVAVYDANGSIDFAEVSGVNQGTGRLRLDRSLSKQYRRTDGAAVVGFEEISYRVADVSGVPTLVREVGDGAAQPLAPHVVRFSITYYDNSVPPVSFQPADPEEQANIRAVEIELVLLTENERIDLGDRPRVLLRTRVAPRSLTIS